MTGAVLSLHIIGAVLSLVYLVAGIVQIGLRRGNARLSKFAAVGLVFWQGVSGMLLIASRPGVSIKGVCLQGGLLIGALAVVQWGVVWRLAPAA